jgi:hypothetical protein
MNLAFCATDCNHRRGLLSRTIVKRQTLESALPAMLITWVALCLGGCSASARSWTDIESSRRTWKEAALPEPSEFDYALGAGGGVRWKLTRDEISAVLKSLQKRQLWNTKLPRNKIYHPPREALCAFQFVAVESGTIVIEVRNGRCVSIDAGLFVVPAEDYERIVAVCERRREKPASAREGD